MKRLFVLLIGVISATSGFSQTVINVVARAEGEQVLISYDLQGNAGESYEVRLSCSRDGGKSFTVTPAIVSGAVNRWEAPGTAKAIVWEAKKDLGEFEGDLQFKVTATGKGGTQTTVQKTSPAPSSATGSGSRTAETDNLTFTIIDVFSVPEGFKITFRIKAKTEIEVGFATGTTAEDHFGNVYTVTASDIEGLGVLQGKTRKFIANARKDGEMILKVSKMNSATLTGRMLKNLTIESTVGTIQFTDIPR
jgi:hypothetical protein